MCYDRCVRNVNSICLAIASLLLRLNEHCFGIASPSPRLFTVVVATTSLLPLDCLTIASPLSRLCDNSTSLLHRASLLSRLWYHCFVSASRLLRLGELLRYSFTISSLSRRLRGHYLAVGSLLPFPRLGDHCFGIASLLPRLCNHYLAMASRHCRACVTIALLLPRCCLAFVSIASVLLRHFFAFAPSL